MLAGSLWLHVTPWSVKVNSELALIELEGEFVLTAAPVELRSG